MENTVLNGRIINIEDDMIEIKAIPVKNFILLTLLIGIPEHLNIEKIFLKSNDDDLKDSLKDIETIV